MYHPGKEPYIAKNPVVFNPVRHCGATNRQSREPCRKPKGWGTKHPGTGRCKLHGGASIGVKTEEGKKRSSLNSMKADIYGNVLRGKDLKRYEKVKEYKNGEILQSNFHLIQAKLLGAIEGDVKLSPFFEKLVGIAEVLKEEGEATDADIILLKQLLSGADVEKLTRVMVSSSSLVRSVIAAADEGDALRENQVLRRYLIESIQTGDIKVKQLAAKYFVLLQKDARIPVETIKHMLEEARTPPNTIEATPLESEENIDDSNNNSEIIDYESEETETQSSTSDEEE